MEIKQGDLFWVDLPEPHDAEPGYRRPCVVIQNNLLNDSLLKTVVVCVLTTNLKRAQFPGNLLLNQGESGLPKQSVVNITQIVTVNKKDLHDKIGVLSQNRLHQVLAGIWFLIESKETER